MKSYKRLKTKYNMKHLPFPQIEFNEELHTYTDTETGELLTSVTTALKKFTKPFDKAFWLPKSAAKAGVSTYEMDRTWKSEAILGAQVGTQIHFYIEQKFKNKIVKPSFDVPFELRQSAVERYNVLKPHADKYVEDHKYYNVVMQEAILTLGSLAGQVDMLVQDENGDYFLIDYKTNKKLGTFPENMLNELSHIKAHDINKFSLQLSCYQLMLESIGYKIKDRLIIWLNKDNESYVEIPVPFMKDEAEFLINYNYNQ
jgi:ATP-dependent exoDNAse (exonuclease V) beta subunit